MKWNVTFHEKVLRWYHETLRRSREVRKKDKEISNNF